MTTQHSNHIIVISFDCLSAFDIPIIEKFPHFQRLFKNAAFCKKVETVYPSLTYPCHTSIVTGNYPAKHGIINNTVLQPGWSSPDWFWQRYHIKGTTLYDEAKTAGMKTAALLWPVTAKASIDFHMPEIFANRPWLHQIPVSLANGSVFYQLQMNQLYGHIRNGLSQPELDDFVTASAAHTIKHNKPGLTLIHFTDLDTQRHQHGFHSTEAQEALRRHDWRLGQLFTALEESGLYEHSTIIALGDHSALDHDQAIQLNVLFNEIGLIELNDKGSIANWKAYCKSCDGSAYVYLHNQQDTTTLEKVKSLLNQLQKDQQNGIEKVLTGEEAAKLGADDQCAFMLEARKGFYFHERIDGNLIEEITSEAVQKKRYTRASHGYSPTKDDYHTVFFATGKGIQPHVEIPHMRLVDIGPTLAHLLGVSLGETDGQIVSEMVYT